MLPKRLVVKKRERKYSRIVVQAESLIERERKYSRIIVQAESLIEI